MIKAVLFDLDGTVADTNTLILTSFRHTFLTHAIKDVSDIQIYSFFGEPLKNSMLRFAPELADDLMVTYRRFNEDHHDAMIRPFPGVKETLEKLKAMGLRLGIVTSKQEKTARQSLMVLGLCDYFEIVVSPEYTKRHKPHPDPVLYAIEKLGVSPEEAMMVGDSPFDLLAGRGAGCLTCGVRYTKIELSELVKTKPDYLIDEFQELADILAQLKEDAS